MQRMSGLTYRLSPLLLLIGLACAAAATGGAAPSTTPAAAGASHWRETVKTFAAEHFKNPAWGYSHCERDYGLARELASADRVSLDDDVLFAAAYLHDLAAFPPWAKAGVDHADEAATVLDSILKGTGFPMEKTDAVRGAIRTHMYDRDPIGPEALYLHDADALDWLGAIGVARIIALVDPNGGKPTGPEAIAMLEANLKSVPERVLSPAARSRVAARSEEMRKFLSDLRRESDDLRTL